MEDNPLSAPVLRQLGVRFRCLPLGEGKLLFCTLPGGITFDLWEREEGVLLWRFVGRVPWAGGGPLPKAGWSVTVTEEGDVCLCRAGRLSAGLVGEFIRAISHPAFTSF